MGLKTSPGGINFRILDVPKSSTTPWERAIQIFNNSLMKNETEILPLIMPEGFHNHSFNKFQLPKNRN